jgi:hypothetical protein
MADIPGKNATSAPPGSDLADSYLMLQKYLVHKPSTFFADRSDTSRSTWSLAGKEILGNDGAFYTADMFSKKFDENLQIKPNDLTIYWLDKEQNLVNNRPFSSVGLKSFIGYKGTDPGLERKYIENIKLYDDKIGEIETAVFGFLEQNQIPKNYVKETGDFKVDATKNSDGNEVDPVLTFNFRRQRAIPDPDSLKKNVDIASTLAKRTITKAEPGELTSFLLNITTLKDAASKIISDANLTTQNIGIAGSSNFNIQDNPDLLKPHVSLYEYKGNTITLETSTTDYCDAFFNLIDNVNLSLSVPFIRINIIDRLSKSKKKNPRLSLVSFLKSTGNKDIDDTIFSNSSPILKSASDHLKKKVRAGKYVGVDVFQSPPTLLPDPTDLITNPRRLDPSVPLMTLQSLNISIESQGTAMLSRKRGELSIVIHDRSRLNEVSSLLSLGDFSSLYFDIEWGYIHPHGDKSFNNPVGQYLNSLRLREIYAPNTYTMSMGESGAITVNISMLAGGYLDATNAPITTGDYVPRSLATRMLNSYISNITLLSKDQSKIDSFEAEVRPITEILVQKDTAGKFVRRSFLEQIIKSSAAIFSDTASQDPAAEALTSIGSLQTLLRENDESQAYKTTDFIANLTENLKISNVKGFGDVAYSKLSSKYTGTTQESYASVGSILTQCVGIPFAMTGLYSEVQIHVFRFNDSAGFMAGQPISKSCLPIEDYIGKIDEIGSLYSSDSIATALARLCKVLSNPDALTYGIATQPDTSAKGAPAATNAAPPPTAGTPATSADTAAKAAGKTTPKKTPSFTTPNIKTDIRTVPVKVFAEGENLPIDGSPDPEKPILQVIIYDDNRLIDQDDLKRAYAYLSDVRQDPITGPTSSKEDNRLSLDDAKLLNKIAYPNITYGAVNSVIKSISVSTNSRSAIGTYATIQAGKEMINDQLKSVTTSEIRQMQLIPGSVTLTIFGLPIIERGQSIYLDIGTGTTLDQLYKVTAVRHNLSNDFTTDLTLQFVGQGTLVNMENVIDDYLKGQEQLNAKKMPDVSSESPTSAPTRLPDAPSKSGGTTGIDPITGRPLDSL